MLVHRVSFVSRAPVYWAMTSLVICRFLSVDGRSGASLPWSNILLYLSFEARLINNSSVPRAGINEQGETSLGLSDKENVCLRRSAHRP